MLADRGMAQTLTTLFSFPGGAFAPVALVDSGYTTTGLVQGKDGLLYGTTFVGGTNYGSAIFEPTIFRMRLSGEPTILFVSSGSEDSSCELVLGDDGSFYGATVGGGNINGTVGNGTVFKFSSDGVFTLLYSFAGATDGERPPDRLTQGKGGFLYGTTGEGGTNGFGTVFKIGTNGVLTTLYSFTGGNDGGGPNTALVLASDGNFYGTTGFGTVFRITPDGSLTTIYTFPLLDIGVFRHQTPGRLLQGNDSFLYGTTDNGGTNGAGSVYRLTLDGALTTLYSLTGSDDGGAPGWLLQANDGFLYGTTAFGGRGGNGTVFRIGTAGVLTTLYSFTGKDGSLPNSALVQANDGNIYGTTSRGGTDGVGTIFRLNISSVPLLNLTPYGQNLLLSWPTNFTGYTPQSATDLNSAVWTTNLPEPVLVNGQYTVTNVVSGTHQFFRLKELK
jgi:uncharacterized repeat protein (TIGR03803 family)